MSILIKGMEMPKKCAVCDVLKNCPHHNPCAQKVHKRCPIVPVQPHGRLIDADAFEVISFKDTEGRLDTFDSGVMWAMEKIDSAPTIIPAEEAHNGE